MGHSKSMHLDPAAYQLAALGDGPKNLGKMAGVAGLALSIAAFAMGITGGHPEQFAMSWLVGSVFVTTIGLGGLFFTMLQHLTKAGWSVTVRRIAEIASMTLPFAAILLAPLIAYTAAMHWGGVFPWADREFAATDYITSKKTAYLNTSFFVVRIALYFAIWIWLANTFYKRSVEQDQSGDVEITKKLQWLAAPGMILFALSVSFFAFDVLMSIDPHWFSTIFGVYIFAGAHLSVLSVMALVAIRLMRRPEWAKLITKEHLHDVGKLMFAFTFFWGYIAFSQYMLYWYANIPEETLWFQLRSEGTWGVLLVVLLVGHLFVPFAGLLSRHVKRDPKRLAFWAWWLLAMQVIDIYWIARPGLDSHSAHAVASGGHGAADHAAHHAGDAAHAVADAAHAADAAAHHVAHQLPAIGLVDILAIAGPILLGIWFALRVASKASLVPLKDPRLEESVGLVNI